MRQTREVRMLWVKSSPVTGLACWQNLWMAELLVVMCPPLKRIEKLFLHQCTRYDEHNGKSNKTRKHNSNNLEANDSNTNKPTSGFPSVSNTTIEVDLHSCRSISSCASRWEGISTIAKGSAVSGVVGIHLGD